MSGIRGLAEEGERKIQELERMEKVKAVRRFQ